VSLSPGYSLPHPAFQYSLCNEPLIELSNPGASGSLFYVTSDDEFIIKTVMHKEAEFLQKLLPGYYMVRGPTWPGPPGRPRGPRHPPHSGLHFPVSCRECPHGSCKQDPHGLAPSGGCSNIPVFAISCSCRPMWPSLGRGARTLALLPIPSVSPRSQKSCPMGSVFPSTPEGQAGADSVKERMGGAASWCLTKDRLLRVQSGSSCLLALPPVLPPL
jgi:hypothetical protein